jgi:hypothetical protein
MKINWLKQTALVLSLVVGAMGTSAFAANHGGGHGGGSGFSGGNNGGIRLQSNGPTNIVRNIGNNQNIQPQIKTLNGGGNAPLGIQLPQNNPLSKLPQINSNTGIVPPHLSGNTIKKIGDTVQGNQIHIDPNLSHKIGDAIGNKIHVDPNLSHNIGNAINGNKIHMNPDLAHKINPTILGKCNPGCKPGSFPGCKPGCYPWWYSPFWGTCYSSCSPCYYNPAIYTQTIVIPVATATTPVATGISPVDALFGESLMQVPVGATVNLQAPGLGTTPGQVVVQMDKISLPAQVSTWTNDGVTTTLPMIGLNGNVTADILVVRPDGSLGTSVKVELIQAQLPTSESAVAALGQ